MAPHVRLEQLYWEDVDPALHAGKPAVSASVFSRCALAVLQPHEFAALEATLRAVAASIPHKGFADVPWHETRWTAAHLLEECGFVRTDEPTMLLVEGGEAPPRYAVKYVYLPVDEESAEMRALCEYAFDEEGGRGGEAEVRGQSVVCRRGNKAMNTGSTMLMYGSWDCWDWEGAAGRKGVTQPRVYNPKGAVDPQLMRLLHRHADALNAAERECIPAYAAHRDALAAEVDPQRMHRVSPSSSAFSVSLTSSYVIAPHNDSGLACETIAFLRRNGPMPPGHEWLFAIGGHVHALPSRRGKGVLLFIKGTGLYHGTLPTSSVAPTHLHGNHGSALVTKQRMVDGLRRQRARGEATPAHLTSAYTGPPPPHHEGGGAGGEHSDPLGVPAGGEHGLCSRLAQASFVNG